MKTNIALLIEQSVNVIDSLNKGLRLTPEEQLFFCEHFEREEIKKNEFTIRIGDYEKYLYFIESGILRYWTAQEYGDPDKEVTFWFSFPGEFADGLHLRRSVGRCGVRRLHFAYLPRRSEEHTSELQSQR